MRKETIYYRENLIFRIWREKRSVWSMQDVADIFSISVGNVYRIIKKKTELNKKGRQQGKSCKNQNKLN